MASEGLLGDAQVDEGFNDLLQKHPVGSEFLLLGAHELVVHCLAWILVFFLNIGGSRYTAGAIWTQHAYSKTSPLSLNSGEGLEPAGIACAVRSSRQLLKV